MNTNEHEGKPTNLPPLSRGTGGALFLLAIFVCAAGCRPGGMSGPSLSIYDLLSGEKVADLHGHNRPTTAIAVSPDGTMALTASLTPELRLWSLAAKQQLRMIELGRRPDGTGPPAYLGPGYTLHFLDGTNTALIGHEAGGVIAWDLETGQRSRSFQAPFQEPHLIAISPDRKTVTAASASYAVTVSWGLADGVRRGVYAEEWIKNSPWVTLTRDGHARSW